MIKPKHFTFNAMTTQCTVLCYGMTNKGFSNLSSQIHNKVNALVEKFNFHSGTSWLNQSVNARTNSRIKIDSELEAILKTVRHHSAIAGGVFDITIGTCSQKIKHTNSISDVQSIKEDALAWMGPQHWAINHSYLEFSNPHTCLDLGGVIKEYAVDLCLELTKEAGAHSALVNFGGDVRSFGRKPNGKRFVAGISDPENSERVLFGLDLENQALTTSGHYARKHSFNDGEVSHVITVNPEEISPPQWESVSVVSASALVSGIYSTSLLIKPNASLGPQTFAVAVDANKKLHQLNPKPSPQQITQHSHKKSSIPNGGIPCV